MPKELKIHSKLTNDYKQPNTIESIGALFTLTYKVTLFLGAFISWIFFSFYVGALPSFTEIGDIAIYLIVIGIWSSLIASFLVSITVASSLLLRYSPDFKSYSNTKLAVYYICFAVLSGIILESLHFYHAPQFVWNIMITFLLFLFPLVYLVFISKKQNKTWLNHIMDNISIASVLILFFPILFLESLMLDELHQWSTYFILIIIIIALNILIVKGIIKSWKDILFISTTYLFTLSMILSMLKIDNPIIIKPFQQLHMGYYSKTLHFKPSKLNELNTTHTFEEMKKLTQINNKNVFILCNIGNDYIFRIDENSTPYRFSKEDFTGSTY